MNTKSLLSTLFFLVPILVFSQYTVSGIVTDTKDNPISGANVFIEGSYDGTMTDQSGLFSFTTSTTGIQTLVVSFVSYQTSRLTKEVASFSNITIKLRDDVNALDAVILNAGSFEAGDKARVSVLKPLDIVTTAGSAGDIVAALQTLPGTQNVGEDGRLFVRGGRAEETQTFVDGIRVAQPYGATLANLPTRGRFSPFLFDGISFSTGGYSAEYGEALSGVLLLETENMAKQNQTDISVMTVGLGLGNTQKWENSSLTFNTAYINLAPYQWLVPQNLKWNKPVQSFSGESVYRKHFKNGLWKVYAAFDTSNFDLQHDNTSTLLSERVVLKNSNFYANTSYKGVLNQGWTFFTGLSYGVGINNVRPEDVQIESREDALHLKMKFKKLFSNKVRWSFGGDMWMTDLEEQIAVDSENVFNIGFKSFVPAVYSELDILFSKRLALKVGMRGTYKALLDEAYISPRLSMAYKTSENAQMSVAYGMFRQSPLGEYLKYNNTLDSERAQHYILNYQYKNNNRLLRIEAYYKPYQKLVKYNSFEPGMLSEINNSGYGHASGVDVFWRDSKSIKNMDYWFSYSYIDSKRNYRNFPTEATPDFVAKHNASLVTKYWINDLRSQVGASLNFNNGRPYHNPNIEGFMQEKTKQFYRVDFNWAYLITAQKILYFSVSNVLGTQNVFGYNYASTPNDNGVFSRKPIIPTADRFIFVGFFWTISDDGKKNQLENL